MKAAGGSSFANIGGATNSSYTTPATQLSDSGTQFLCVVSNSSGPVPSNAATLTVQPPGIGTPLLSSATLGTLRNNYSGWVGMTITVHSSPLTITALGRMFANGNNGTHALKIVNAATEADIAGAAVSVSMSGGTPGSFVYGDLSSPIVLSPNTSYYVLTQESAGGDQWYDYSDTTATTRWVATLNGAIYGTGSPYTTVANSIGHMYVPVDFKYSVPVTNYVTATSLGTPRNDFTGWVGMAVTIGNSPLNVTALGRMVAAGNSGSHTIKLVSAAGVDVAGGSVTVNTLGNAAGAFAYAALSSPVTLNPNTTYYIVSQETSGGDFWCDFNTTLQTNPVAVANPVYGSGTIYSVVPNSIGQSYVPLDFKFQ